MARRELDDAITETRDLARQMERHLDRMQTVLFVREPTSQVAADAYDGLRKQVVTALQERQAHVTQLVQFASALEGGADPQTLKSMVDGWLESSNVVVSTDTSTADAEMLFQVIENLGGDVEVVAPAYVDASTNRVIRQGRIRHAAPIAPVAGATATTDPATAPAESEITGA